MALFDGTEKWGSSPISVSSIRWTLDDMKHMTSFYNRKNAPEHIAKRTDVKYKSIPLVALKKMGMWNSRLDKIIPYMPKDAWIAGGFLRALIAGEDDSCGDIDFFFASEEGFNATLEMIKYPVKGAERGFGY